jgi:hypothetical protein
MNYKLVCIGGTGQMVLHYYAQLYLIGLIEEPFEATVVDTDSVIASLRTLRDFFSNLQYGSDATEGVQTDVPTIFTPRVPIPTDDKVGTALTGRPVEEVDDRHPVRALFNEQTLVQSVNQGLYARPALSSVMSKEIFKDDSLAPKNNSTTVFVGSVIGGTSGGLLAPVVDAMKERQLLNDILALKMRAVLYGRYFTPDDSIIPDAVKRFNSNQLLVLQSIKEALQQLHSYSIVGGTGSMDYTRDPNLEKDARQMPWQEENEPFWFGSQACEYLLKENVIPAAANFSDREVRDDFKRPVSRDAAVKALKQRLAFADTFVEKKVVERLSREPWVNAIWGNKLTELIGSFWNIAVAAEGGKRISSFPEKVQNALVDLWNGADERLGLRYVFPAASPETTQPASIQRLNWPTLDQSKVNKNLFTSADVTAKRAAATILFTIMRRGI